MPSASRTQPTKSMVMNLRIQAEARDLIDRAVALEVAPNVEALKMSLKGIAVSAPGIL